MKLHHLTVTLLIHALMAEGCTDIISTDQCIELDCIEFPDLALMYCPKTCQVCHNVNTSKPVPPAIECQDDISYSQCHQLDCQTFPSLAKQYCQRTCGLCPQQANCSDDEDCAKFGPTICTRFPDLAVQACPVYCNRCVNAIGSSLTAGYCFDDGYVGKQPIGLEGIICRVLVKETPECFW